MATLTATGLIARVKRFDLIKALRHLAPLTSARTIPVMQGVLLTVDENGIMTGTTTNDDVTLKVGIPAETTAPGSLVVNAKDLLLAAQYAPGEELALAVNRFTMNVTADETEVSLEGFNTDMFPKSPEEGWEPFFTIGRGDLAEMSAAVATTVGDDESKPWLESIFLTAGESLRAISSDGIRIGAWEKPVEVHQFGSVIIPPLALRLASTMAAPGEMVRVSKDGERLRLSGHNFEVIGRTVMAQYPDVWRLVPSEYPVSTVVDREALLNVSNLATRWSHDGAMRFTIGESRITAEAYVPEKGKFARHLPATVSGKVDPTGVNSRLFAPLLKQLTGREVKMQFTNPRSPILVTCADQPHLRYVLLPLITY